MSQGLECVAQPDIFGEEFLQAMFMPDGNLSQEHLIRIFESLYPLSLSSTSIGERETREISFPTPYSYRIDKLREIYHNSRSRGVLIPPKHITLVYLNDSEFKVSHDSRKRDPDPNPLIFFLVRKSVFQSQTPRANY